MRKTLAAAAAVIGLAAFAAPVHAATVVDAGNPAVTCASVASAHGCLFDGNINLNTNTSDKNSYLWAEAAYNSYANAQSPKLSDIALDPLFDTDSLSPFPGTGSGGTSGTWSLPGYLVDFVAVKAADYFVLYQITPASNGSWDTFDIPYKNNPHDLSHLVFFGDPIGLPPVPEPATWALFILGFGFVGAMLRSSRARESASLTA